MTQNYELKGNCVCGEVKYKITEKPLFTQACHCKDCKVLTGSSYVVNTSILDNSFFLIEGKMSTAKLTAGSGKTCKVFFCNSCGVFVYADYDTAIGRLTVRTKTLEDANMFPPQAHIFIKDKDPWLNLEKNQNCFELMYDAEKTWPEESLKRYKEYLKTKK